MARTRTVVRIDSRLADETARVLGAKPVQMLRIWRSGDGGAPKLQKLMKKHANKLKFAAHDR
jgi:hypothetical protein